MTAALGRLQDNGFKIGIVTGSGMDYIIQQCNSMFDMTPVNYLDIDYFPCNGTKSYKYAKGQYSPELIYENHMKEKLGEKAYKKIIYELASFQCRLRNTDYGEEIPLTGNFIDCRGSMINWCPIGRNASKQERKLWCNLDKEHDIRLNILNSYFNIDMFQNLTVKLGGSTSFDIFPKGWDKTYVLRNFSDHDHIYFFGDKCEENGDDKEIYDEVLRRENGKAFKTKNPDHTIKLIDGILKGS